MLRRGVIIPLVWERGYVMGWIYAMNEERLGIVDLVKNFMLEELNMDWNQSSEQFKFRPQKETVIRVIYRET